MKLESWLYSSCRNASCSFCFFVVYTIKYATVEFKTSEHLSDLVKLFLAAVFHELSNAVLSPQ